MVGLGNPGEKYAKTRHNVGFMVVDALAMRPVNEVKLVKPDTFMNQSGEAVKKLMANGKWQMDDLYVVHDDLDIGLGNYKIQKGRGPKDHNGVLSVEQSLGSKNFWRVRVGVDNRSSDISGDEYVLSEFREDELETLNKVIDRVIGDLRERLR